MESLIANFVQFSCVNATFLFFEQRLGTRLCLRSILRFSWIFQTLSLMSLGNSYDNWYIQFLVIII